MNDQDNDFDRNSNNLGSRLNDHWRVRTESEQSWVWKVITGIVFAFFFGWLFVSLVCDAGYVR